jgi:hypothetical protein
MGWPIVEVVIGLAFLSFLLSVIASAINEAIAGWMKLRAKTLEAGIKNLLTGSTRPSEKGQELVDELYNQHPGQRIWQGQGQAVVSAIAIVPERAPRDRRTPLTTRERGLMSAGFG